MPEPLNEDLAEGWVSGVADLPLPSRAETNRGELMYRFEPENARIREKLYVPAYTKAKILIADDPRINADGCRFAKIQNVFEMNRMQSAL